MEKVVVPGKNRKNVFFEYIYDVVREVNPDYQIDVDDSLDEFKSVDKSVMIEIIPYISVTDEITLISDYVKRYFKPNEDETFSYIEKGDYDYWQAEFALIQRIMDTMTNVDTVETNANEMVEIFYLVVEKISNYHQFRERLDETIGAIKDSKSIGVVIDNLVNNATELFESFKSIDPEKIKELADSVVKTIESSNVAPIFTEANKQVVSDTNLKNNKSKTKKSKELKVE